MEFTIGQEVIFIGKPSYLYGKKATIEQEGMWTVYDKFNPERKELHYRIMFSDGGPLWVHYTEIAEIVDDK